MYSAYFVFFIFVCCVGGTEAQFRCDFPICPFDCEYGTKPGRNQYGCELCLCSEAPSCPPRPDCSLAYCTLGFKHVDGCTSPTCECNSPVCHLRMCTSSQCPLGLGYAQDSPRFGCPTCECRRAESHLPCIKPSCLALLDCFTGSSLVTVNGCPICKCENQVCPPTPSCDGIVCPLGFAYENGCKTCRCLRNCPDLTCSRVRCSRGFAADSNGCPTCRCNRSPFGHY